MFFICPIFVVTCFEKVKFKDISGDISNFFEAEQLNTSQRKEKDGKDVTIKKMKKYRHTKWKMRV